MLYVEAAGQNETAEENWQGQFQLENGLVLSCLVCAKTDGQILLVNDEAIRWLTAQGRLEWQIEELTSQANQFLLPPPQYPARTREQPDTTPAIPALPVASWEKQYKGVPIRAIQGNNAPLSAFSSREERQVYALIDGRRSVEEVIRLLHKPPELVMRVLQDLQAKGFIA
jgi:hypothetical protein